MTAPMQYRTLPRTGERLSAIGLGMAYIDEAPVPEIGETLRLAVERGVNVFDLCGSTSKAIPAYGRALRPVRERVFVQHHFGAVYPSGEYGWSRDLAAVKKEHAARMAALGFDYADFGFLHCTDEPDDLDALRSSGIRDWVEGLKRDGVVRHLGFSSHNPAVAAELVKTGAFDLCMFSINPAYDWTKGDEFARGAAAERAAFYRLCEKEGVGISVMTPFFGGQLLDAARSPFGKALTREQCIQYALDRPAVVSVLPGIRGKDDLLDLLAFLDAPAEARDYAVLGTMAPPEAAGVCTYCNHCKPCPRGIDIGMANRYYDLSLAGDPLAAGHYAKLARHASDCTACGHCERRCPFHVRQIARMEEIAARFGQ